jgi:hypothetical protein
MKLLENFAHPLEVHRQESGFTEVERLPIDAITSLGSFASLIRLKSTTGKDQILWLSQANPLIPHRQTILELRHDLAVEIAQIKDKTRLRNLLELYYQTDNLLLRSYGYWDKNELKEAYQNLNLEAINRDYRYTMDTLTRQSQTAREQMALAHSRAEFVRGQQFELGKNLLEKQYHQQQKMAEQTENWLFHQFEQQILPELQKEYFLFSKNKLETPKLKQFFVFSWGISQTDVAEHWQEILLKYQKYAQAFGQKNPDLWLLIEPLVNLRVGNINTEETPLYQDKLEGFNGWLNLLRSTQD